MFGVNVAVGHQGLMSRMMYSSLRLVVMLHMRRMVLWRVGMMMRVGMMRVMPFMVMPLGRAHILAHIPYTFYSLFANLIF